MLPFCEKMWNHPKFKRMEIGGVFFAVDRNLLSNPKTFSLEPVVLACKKLLQFEQVFLRENFCENVAEIAKCSNYGFEIKTVTTFFSNV